MLNLTRNQGGRLAALFGACLAAGGALGGSIQTAAAQTAPAEEQAPVECSEAMNVGGRTITLKASEIIEQPMDMRRLELQPGEYVLTFDDGPTWVTYFITDIMDRYCAKGVFFMVGARAQQNPDMVEKVVAGGHEIASSTLDQKALTKMPLAEARVQIEEGRKAVQAIAGVDYPVLLLRPPAYYVNEQVRLEIGRLGLIEVGSDLTPQDWRGDAPEAAMERMLAEFERADRGMVLLHDNQPNTRDLLTMILTHFAETGKKAVLLKVEP